MIKNFYIYLIIPILVTLMMTINIYGANTYEHGNYTKDELISIMQQGSGYASMVKYSKYDYALVKYNSSFGFDVWYYVIVNYDIERPIINTDTIYPDIINKTTSSPCNIWIIGYYGDRLAPTYSNLTDLPYQPFSHGYLYNPIVINYNMTNPVTNNKIEEFNPMGYFDIKPDGNRLSIKNNKYYDSTVPNGSILNNINVTLQYIDLSNPIASIYPETPLSSYHIEIGNKKIIPLMNPKTNNVLVRILDKDSNVLLQSKVISILTLTDSQVNELASSSININVEYANQKQSASINDISPVLNGIFGNKYYDTRFTIDINLPNTVDSIKYYIKTKSGKEYLLNGTYIEDYATANYIKYWRLDGQVMVGNLPINNRLPITCIYTLQDDQISTVRATATSNGNQVFQVLKNVTTNEEIITKPTNTVITEGGYQVVEPTPSTTEEFINQAIESIPETPEFGLTYFENAPVMITNAMGVIASLFSILLINPILTSLGTIAIAFTAWKFIRG